MPTVTIDQRTITVYKVTCTKAHFSHEVGTGYCLRPWGGDTPDYQGYDDGGRDYYMPDGYELLESQIGKLTIYRTAGLSPCALVTTYTGGPAIVDGGAYRMIPLIPVVEAD